jgi:hypothetical protein
MNSLSDCSTVNERGDPWPAQRCHRDNVIFYPSLHTIHLHLLSASRMSELYLPKVEVVLTIKGLRKRLDQLAGGSQYMPP